MPPADDRRDVDGESGVLLGLACGDALGRPVEFLSGDDIARRHGRVTEMLGNGTHGEPPGTVTDDTEMALCVARSLAAHGEFRPDDVAERFVEWYDSDPFDIGLMTREALRGLERGGSWREVGQRVWAARSEGSNAGNGSVMRCAPHALAFEDRTELARVSRLSSAITHADPRCTWGCAVLNLVLSGLRSGRTAPLADALAFVGADAPAELRTALEPVAAGDRPDDLQSTGYTVHTLQAALYHGLTADTAEGAVVDAVAMGDDTDTVGAVAGAVAGARFGASALPERWLAALACRAELESLAATLAATTVGTDDEY